ncbi:MAG: hypothetical protein AB7Q17_16000 [Phycisphaerae bacterium]
MKPIVWTVILSIVIAAAGLRLWWFYAAQPSAGQPIERPAPIACAACGKSYVGLLGREPTRCRACNQRNAWQALQCAAPRCGMVFAWVRDPSATPAEMAPPRCPKCGGGEAREPAPEALTDH